MLVRQKIQILRYYYNHVSYNAVQHRTKNFGRNTECTLYILIAKFQTGKKIELARI